MAMNPFSSRINDLSNKDLVDMLRAGRTGNTKYAIVDAQRREVHTAAPSGKLPALSKHDLPKIKSAKLRKIFG